MKVVPKLLFYVQHLLGTGHLVRSLWLAESIMKKNIEVFLVYGGRWPQFLSKKRWSFPRVALPSIYAKDASFQLYDMHDKILKEPFQNLRTENLLEIYSAYKPDILLTETFPLGRHAFQFELLPLLEQKSKPKHCFVSVRDVVQPFKKEEKWQQALDWYNTYYQGALVHGDETFLPINLPSNFARLHYTGYVTPPPSPREKPQEKVLVMLGGGAINNKLSNLVEALASEKTDLEFVFVGLGQIPKTKHITYLESQEDLYQTFSQYKFIISYAGYNNFAQIISQKIPCIFIPYQQQGEQEQALRCAALKPYSLYQVVQEEMLSVDTLKEAIDALDLKGTCPALNVQGAEMSAEILYNYTL